MTNPIFARFRFRQPGFLQPRSRQSWFRQPGARRRATAPTTAAIALAAIATLLPVARAAAQTSPGHSSPPGTSPASPSTSPAAGDTLLQRISPSMVAVQWTWAYEYGRSDYVGAGVVVRDDGLIAFPMEIADPGVPDVQMVDFKIIIPSRDDRDEQEIDAVFQGRDERCDLAFVRPKDPSARKWIPVVFEDLPVRIGDRVSSIGMQVRSSGYHAFRSEGIVAGFLRRDVLAVIVTGGGLASVGGPVFNDAGRAVGFVNAQGGAVSMLHATGGKQAEFFEDPSAFLSMLRYQPAVFTPTRELLIGLGDPPTPDRPLAYPWIGASLTGMQKDVAEAFGLKDQPAIEVSDVVPGSPCDKAGLKIGMKIVQLDGKPLERGESDGDLPRRLTRKFTCMPPGTVVRLSVLTEKGKPLTELTLTLEKRPVRQNELPRFWAEDLGFSVRDITFADTYDRKQPPDLKGVTVSLVRPNSAAANARLEFEHIVQSINGLAINGRDQFKTEYEKLRAAKPKEAIVLVVLNRDGSTQTLRIEPPQ